LRAGEWYSLFQVGLFIIYLRAGGGVFISSWFIYGYYMGINTTYSFSLLRYLLIAGGGGLYFFISVVALSIDSGWWWVFTFVCVKNTTTNNMF